MRIITRWGHALLVAMPLLLTTFVPTASRAQSREEQERYHEAARAARDREAGERAARERQARERERAVREFERQRREADRNN